MKKKTVSLLLVAAMAVGMLAGCGGGKSSISQDGSSDAAEGNEKAEMADAKDVDGTTITFWHSMGGVNGQAIDTLVKKFNDENEYGITVEAQYQGEYDDSLNKLKSAQIGNMGADLVQVTQLTRLEAFPQLLQRGVVALDVADGPDKPLRRESPDEALGVLEGFREGLLDERVHAGLGHL